MKTLLAITISLLGLYSAQAIILGEIELTGNFTLNHSYNFNQPSAAPYGMLGPMEVENVTGLFALTTIDEGDMLGMSTPFVPGAVNGNATAVSFPVTWSLGGYSFDLERVWITGADSSRSVGGQADMSFLGFKIAEADPDFSSAPHRGFYSDWWFTAPPHEIVELQTGGRDITGPIELRIQFGFVPEHRRNHFHRVCVPDTGSTLGMLAFALCGLPLLRRR